MRWQQVTNGKELRTPRNYTELWLRQDNRIRGRAGAAVTLKMLIGNTKHDENTLTLGYDHNWDSGPPKTVFNGTLNTPSTSGTNNDAAKFILYVNFSKPFLWIPKKGEHLLIETVQTSTTSRIVYMDQHSGGGFPATQVYAFSATATRATSSLGNRGFIMGLAYSGAIGSSVPAISANGRPSLGNASYSVNVGQALPNTAGILVLGASNSKWGVIPLPLGLAALGAPKCSLLVSANLMLAVAINATGGASVKFPIPNIKTLVGAKFYNQYIIVDPKANGLGLVFSNGGESKIGSL